jgi:flagellar hook-length control protein FliK
MEMIIGNIGLTQAGTAASKSGVTFAKEEGKGSFSLLLQAAGLSMQEAGAQESKTGQEGLLAALAALAGGLSPLMLSELQQPEITAEERAQGLILNIKLGESTLLLPLNDLALNNSELARVVKEYGAPVELLTVLLETPDGNPVETLKSHPQLLAEFGQALTTMIQTLTEKPQLLAHDAKTAAFFQTLIGSLRIEAVQETGEADFSTPNPAPVMPVKVNSALGKLQATISVHTLQVAQMTEETAAMNEDAAGKAQVSSEAVAMLSAVTEERADAKTKTAKSAPEAQSKQADQPQVPVAAADQSYLRLPERKLKLESVVTMRADQVRTELSNMVVKRAMLVEAPGRHEFRIVLEPQGLGEVEVRIQSVNHQISVQLIADSLASKGMLDSALAGLKLQLQAQGIQYDRIEVQTASQNNAGLGSGLPEHHGSGQNNREQQQGGHGQRIPVETFTLTDEVELPEESLMTPDRIDVTA